MTAVAAATVAVTATRRRGQNVGARRSSSVTVACGGDASRVAGPGDVVRVTYTGTLEDGTVFDTNVGKDPISFTVGGGNMIEGFDKAVTGLKVGDKVSVKFGPEEAYGDRKDGLVITFPKEQAPPNVEMGSSVTLSTPSGGQVRANVISIGDDGAVTVDANPPMAGKVLCFDIELVGFRELMAAAEPPPGMELATFAAGCFWGVELAFQRIPGVISTSVGYAQGEKEKPSYEEVCSKTTGHTEAIRVVFDPKELKFEQLLEKLWERVGGDAVNLNKAGNDEGPQYRSGIYYHSEEQRVLAAESKAALQEELGETVVTEVEEAKPFWMAEDYHQQYLSTGGRNGNPQSAEKGCTDTIRCYG